MQLMEFNIGDHTALKLAEADTRREALEEGAAAAPAGTSPIARAEHGRAKMAGQPWMVSPARHESTWLPLVVGAQRNKDTATPDTADDTMDSRLRKRKQRERGTSIEQQVKKKAAGTRTRRAARDEDQIALELAEAESRREALEEGTAAAPASTAPIARTRQPEPDEEGWRKMPKPPPALNEVWNSSLESNPCVAMSDSGKYKSITQRYPGIKGKLLRDKVDSDYVSETNRTLRFLDSNGKELLRAHDLNERNQGVVIEEYVAGILEHGLIADVRSKPICIPSKSQYDDAQNEGNCESFMLVGHWQLCSAIYEAHRREPDNKQVIATIRDGLK